jgi:ABC-2 type transport system permease protein
MNYIKLVAAKEFKHVLRDRRTVTMILWMPLIFMLIFGLAATGDVRNVPWVIVDYSQSATSRLISQEIMGTGFFAPPRRLQTYSQVEAAFMDGSAIIAVVFPPEMSRKLHSGEPAPVQVLLAGTDPSISIKVLNYINQIIMNFQVRLTAERLSAMNLQLVPLEVDDRFWYNPNLLDSLFYIPGLIGVILTQVLLTLTAYTIIGEKERGTMEQLISSPIGAYQLVIGKLIPYASVAVWDIVLIMSVARFVFHMSDKGSLALLALGSFIFIVASLGVGLLVSTAVDNQQQATYLVMFYMLPSMMISGYFFPIVSMPKVIQGISALLPLRYYLVILRGIIVKGNTILELWPQFLALTLFAVFLVALSAVRFRKVLE